MEISLHFFYHHMNKVNGLHVKAWKCALSFKRRSVKQQELADYSFAEPLRLNLKMAAMKKASRGTRRAITSQVANDPNDKTGEFIDESELISHYKKRVTQAQIWERPLHQSPGLQPLGIVHQGIVVTMEDGKTYLVHKVASGDDDGLGITIVTDSSKMGAQWSLVKTKKVKSAKLEDYLDACGEKYDVRSDNCIHAVKRMWELE